jgi:hypothetical protein
MAMEMFEKGLAIAIKALGEEDLDVASIKMGMAKTLEKQGELARAEGLFRECAGTYCKLYGAEHEETLDALEQARGCEKGN